MTWNLIGVSGNTAYYQQDTSDHWIGIPTSDEGIWEGFGRDTGRMGDGDGAPIVGAAGDGRITMRTSISSVDSTFTGPDRVHTGSTGLPAAFHARFESPAIEPVPYTVSAERGIPGSRGSTVTSTTSTPETSSRTSGTEATYLPNERQLRDELGRAGLEPQEIDAFMSRFPLATTGNAREEGIRERRIAEFLPPRSGEDTRAGRGIPLFGARDASARPTAAQLRQNILENLRDRAVAGYARVYPNMPASVVYENLAARGIIVGEHPPADSRTISDVNQHWTRDRDYTRWTVAPTSGDGARGPITRDDFSNPIFSTNPGSITTSSVEADTRRRQDVTDYLNSYPAGADRDAARERLHTTHWTDGDGVPHPSFIDSHGGPAGNWSHDTFARAFYRYGGEREDSVPTGTEPLPTDHRREISTSADSPMGRVTAALDPAHPDFAAARQALSEIHDPLTRDAANRVLTESYVQGVHRTLTDPNGPYHFSEEDAVAIEVRRGLRSPDGEIRSDLSVGSAEDEFRRYGGFATDGSPVARPDRDGIMTDTAGWYRDHLTDDMHRLGMNGEHGAGYMAHEGYLGEEASLSSGTFGRMLRDHRRATEALAGNQTTRDTLAREWIAAGNGTTRPSGTAGNQYLEIRGNIDESHRSGSRSHPDPEIERARDRLHESASSRRSASVAERNAAATEDANRIREEEMAHNDERARLDRDERAAEARERLTFDRENADANRALQREQMRQQMIATVLQTVMSAITAAFQVMGQVAAGHIAGQYQVQAGIMQRFRNT